MKSFFRSGCTNCGDPVFRGFSAFSRGRCLLCALRWRHRTSEPKVPVNPEAWSESSKRSRSFSGEPGQSYTNEYYWCRRCAAPAVFTAEQQRDACEVRKRSIHQRRVLCDPCWKADADRKAEAVSRGSLP